MPGWWGMQGLVAEVVVRGTDDKTQSHLGDVRMGRANTRPSERAPEGQASQEAISGVSYLLPSASLDHPPFRRGGIPSSRDQGMSRAKVPGQQGTWREP